jgi:hypothetical protein
VSISEAMMNLLVPHEPVGWFLFLLWIGLMVPLVLILMLCVLELSIRAVCTLWQWFSHWAQRRQERYFSCLRSTLETSYHSMRARDGTG